MKSYHVYSCLEGHLFCFSLWNQPADAVENGRRRQRASRGLLVGALGWWEGEKRKSAFWMRPCPCSQGTLEKRCTRKDGPCGGEKKGWRKSLQEGPPWSMDRRKFFRRSMLRGWNGGFVGEGGIVIGHKKSGGRGFRPGLRFIILLCLL